MLFENITAQFFVIASSALLLVVAAVVRFWSRRRNQVTSRHLRGRSLRTTQQVQDTLADTGKKQSIRLGMHLLPHRAAYGHFAIVGATGSGKTLLQRLLMQSVLPRIGTGLEQRALIYDAKQDILSLLAGMNLRCPIATFHPLDARCVAWDMAADITSPAAALQAATLLVPKAQHDANPFFSNAARHIMYAALLALILQAPGRWTLRHLLLVLRSESLLRLVLAQNEFTRPLLQYGEHAATFQNILSTLLTRIAPFEIIAAAWDQAERKLSLRSWLDQESILVLANDEDNRAAIDTINQLLFKRLSELVLARDERPEDSLRTTWFFLDEVRQAGKLDGLSALMTKGRSKGAAVLLGFQDIHGLHDVYGREAANELVGQCNTKALLRLNSPETARWASQLFGSSEFLESRRSHSRSRNFRELGWRHGGSSGESISNVIVKRELVLDSEFLDLPETSFENGGDRILPQSTDRRVQTPSPFRLVATAPAATGLIHAQADSSPGCASVPPPVVGSGRQRSRSSILWKLIEGRRMNHGFCSRSTGSTEARLGVLMSPHPTHLNLPNRVSEIFDAHPLQSH